MSEEIKEVHIKTYDEWLKYYKNATKEQIIEDLTQDVKYFADAVKDIKELQDKLQQKDKEIERLNNIINELEKWLEQEYAVVKANSIQEPNNPEWYIKWNERKNILDKLQELKGEDKE